MNLNEIKEELKGYFIYKNGRDYELAIKEGADFQLITNNINYLGFKETFTLSPIRYLLLQCNNQLLDPCNYINDLSEVVPVIDFQVFHDYDNRAKQIDIYKKLLNQITGSKSIFNRKKDFKLIYVKSHNHLLQEDDQVGYYVIKENEVIPINEGLLDKDYISNAVEVKEIDLIRKALKDDLKNEYEPAYLREVKKYQDI